MPKKTFYRLGSAVASPYFNKKKELVDFFEFLKMHFPQFPENASTYEGAFQHVFGNRPFEKKEIGYLMSDLMKLAERMLSIEQMEEDAITDKLYLLDIFTEWHLDKAFNKTFKDAKKVLDQHTTRDSNYFYWNYSLNLRENVFFHRQKMHKVDNSIQTAIDNLDLFYFAQKLKYCCEMVNRQKVVASDYQINLMDEILDYLDDNPLSEQPVIAIYSTILKLSLEPTKEEYFHQLIGLLNNHSHLFLQNEAKDMYILAVNYCVRQIHKGNDSFDKNLFGLYQIMIEKNVMIYNNIISPWTYMNVVTIGVRNDIDWTETFIHKYSEFLHDNFKENAYNYNLAYLYFYQERYDDAMSLLNKVVYSDVFYNCEARALLIRIYYSIEETELLSALAESFRIYLRRNKIITESRKTVYLSFIKFMSRLDRIIKGDNKVLIKLYEQVKTTGQVYNRDWILNEIKAKMKGATMDL